MLDSETWVTVYQDTQCYIQEDLTVFQHDCENFKCLNIYTGFIYCPDFTEERVL
jgi:hypothetical protein